jgi:hypothetical protein
MKLNCNSFFDGEFKEINLNDFLSKTNIHDTKSPQLVQDELNKLGYNTFGGYGENRKDIFRGSYLEKTKTYFHLGIDINIKAGTPIKCPFDCFLYDVFIDTDTDIGWGGRIILKKNNKCPALILAHLNPEKMPYKVIYLKGDILGEVGTWPNNGNVFQHLHVQAVENLDVKKLDGYGHVEDLLNHPNPFEIEFL